jgi:hypothetical protein
MVLAPCICPKRFHRDGRKVMEDPTWTYQNDLTVEDMTVNILGRDRTTVRVDRKAGLDTDDGMSPLEKEASTLIFDGIHAKCLAIIVGLLNLQAKSKLSDVTMTDIFVAIDDLINPKNANSNMSSNHTNACKIVSKVGLDYHVIHVCPYNKTLYYGPNKILTSYPKYQKSRFKENTIKKNVHKKVSSSPVFFPFNNVFHSWNTRIH